jgi:divalent metal cation (Fe/Co/Zn/Cd) transporter
MAEAAPATPPLTAAERANERSVLAAILLDSMIWCLYMTVGLIGGSLTIIAEAVRGGLLILIESYALVVLRRVHRRDTAGLDFGTGKLEQFCNMLIAGGMIGGALWIAHGAAGLIVAGHSEATPIGLALGACLCAFNNLCNYVAWDGVRRAARDSPSVIMQAQVRIRLTKLLSSLAVQVSITAAALATDPVVVAWADALGALVVTAVIMVTAIRLLRAGLPDLLDRSVDETTRDAVLRTLEAHRADFAALQRIRSRRSGSVVFVEVTAGFDPALPLAEVDARIARMRADLAAAIAGADVTILASAHPSGDPGRSVGGG